LSEDLKSKHQENIEEISIAKLSAGDPHYNYTIM